MERKKITSNSTDKKVTIKRRCDGVYDIYVDDAYTCSTGLIDSVVQHVRYLLNEEDYD